MRNDTHSFTPADEAFMCRALRLARGGRGRASPNPLVGAVVVREGRIVGEGFHREYGGPHAEAEAIRAAGGTSFGSDMYCNLEPCCFTSPEKKQPPCTDLIIRSGIRRLFIANRDPHPLVDGRGIESLRRAGLEVFSELLEKEGEELNEGFFTFQRLGRPWVRLKAAQSLDGRIAAAGGDSKWITDLAARRMAHRLRARHDAVLVGRGTALTDDPELTLRLARGRNPFRVVLDSRLSLREDARVLNLPDPDRTILLCGPRADREKIRRLRDRGATVIPLGTEDPPGEGSGAGLPLGPALSALAGRGIRSILVEGGGGVLTSFLREGLWDAAAVFIAPVIIGRGIDAVGDLGVKRVAEAFRLGEVRVRRIRDQVLVEGKNVHRNR